MKFRKNSLVNLRYNWASPVHDFWIVDLEATNRRGDLAFPVVAYWQIHTDQDLDRKAPRTGFVQAHVIKQSFSQLLVKFPVAFVWHNPEILWVDKSRIILPKEIQPTGNLL